ncbi:MAG TPA: substrate-binding domain-containing protein [Xanthobacteraceae bacterium]|nr:substrate-binding domain-containing protein [Xanthobacteraceae bacterium]
MKVLCTNGVKSVTATLIPDVERAIGLAVDVDYASTNMLVDKIVGGETGDLAVLSAEAIDGLIASGVLQKGSRVDLAKSSIGVAIRRGAVAPDVSTVAALKAALLAAKSVLYSKTGISGVYTPKLFEKLGIAEQIAPKAKNPSSGTVGEALARGEAEIALQQISELLPIAGIKVIAPLPAEVQLTTIFSAGIFTAAVEPRAARMLIEQLTTNAARPLYIDKGLEPAF